MPLRTLTLMALPSILLFVLSPPLPFLAYLLQLWARSSWAWQDRWASVWTWAKQGGEVMTLLLLCAGLDIEHVWFFPTLVTAAQGYWHAHLPGELALLPLDEHTLIARMLLLAPLAPALALFYEYLDPRTRVHLKRVLTPTDLITPATKPAQPNAAPTQPPASPTTDTMPPLRKKKKRQRHPAAAQQMTIESALVPPTVEQDTSPPPTQPAPSHPAPPTINWDDVAE